MFNSPLLIWYLQGLLTPVVAIIAVYIGWRQWKTSSQKLKLDLFERRFRVFQAVRDILGMMYTTVSDDKKLFQLLSQTRDAEFLFGSEIKDYVENVWRRASRLSDTHKQLSGILETAPIEVRQKLAKIENDEVQWAFAETCTMADKFKSYLDVSKL
jgi:hypothetical protein